MGDEDGGSVGFEEDLAHLVANALPQSGVQVREGFVEEDDAGVGREGPRKGDALLLASGELVGHAVGGAR